MARVSIAAGILVVLVGAALGVVYAAGPEVEVGQAEEGLGATPRLGEALGLEDLVPEGIHPASAERDDRLEGGAVDANAGGQVADRGREVDDGVVLVVGVGGG